MYMTHIEHKTTEPAGHIPTATCQMDFNLLLKPKNQKWAMHIFILMIKFEHVRHGAMANQK